MGLKDKPTIVIPQAVYDKIMWWINHADGEVSGMGTVLYDAETKQFYVDDAVLLHQKCSAASTELDAGAVGKAEYAFDEHEGEGMRWWWHSHVNMGVFWSGTDTSTIEELGEHGWFLATVFNKREESKSCIYQGKPFPFFVDDLDLLVESPVIDEELVAQWRADFEDKVKPYAAPTTTYGGYGHNHWSSGDYWSNSRWSKGGVDKTDKYFAKTDMAPKATVTPPVSDDGILYTKEEGLSWVEMYQKLQDSYNDDRLTEGDLKRLDARIEDIETVLDEFIDRRILTLDEVYGGWYDSEDGASYTTI